MKLSLPKNSVNSSESSLVFTFDRGFNYFARAPKALSTCSWRSGGAPYTARTVFPERSKRSMVGTATTSPNARAVAASEMAHRISGLRELEPVPPATIPPALGSQRCRRTCASPVRATRAWSGRAGTMWPRTRPSLRVQPSGQDQDAAPTDRSMKSLAETRSDPDLHSPWLVRDRDRFTQCKAHRGLDCAANHVSLDASRPERSEPAKRASGAAGAPST